MRRMRPLIYVSLVAMTAGCSMYANAARNAINEPRLALDEVRYSRKAHRLASDAWTRFAACQPGAAFADDFRAGYRDGYADYLEAGGAGDPPPFPPHRYTRSRYQTPAGLRAIEDYFNGFRHGAQDAIASGRRYEFVTPVVLPVSAAQTTVLVAPPAAAAAEQLPAPKPAQPPGR